MIYEKLKCYKYSHTCQKADTLYTCELTIDSNFLLDKLFWKWCTY